MKRTSSIGMLGASFAALVAASAMTPAAAQQVAIDANDIGGVVRSAKGPEAGVWVIAETRDLPTRYIKIVVTDDQGRYVLPDLPARATYDIWVRGYGLVDSMKVEVDAGQEFEPHRDRRAQPHRRRAGLSRHLLVRDAEGSGGQSLPRHRRQRQRHADRAQGPGPVAPLPQDRRLHPLPPDRRSVDAHLPALVRHFKHPPRRGSAAFSPVRPAAT